MRADNGNPSPPAASRQRRQIVQTTVAISSLSVPVLLDVKYRIYNAWRRGVHPNALRKMFGKPSGSLTVADINNILVEVCRRELQAQRRAA